MARRLFKKRSGENPAVLGGECAAMQGVQTDSARVQAGTDLRQLIRKVTGTEYDPATPIFANQTSATDTVCVYLEQDS